MNDNPPPPTAPVNVARVQEPITCAGQRIVKAQLGKLRACEDSVRDGTNSEALHDMRVASRRVRSLLRLLRPYYPPKNLKRLRPPLSELAQALGAVRDLDVLLRDARKYADTRPPKRHGALLPLLTDWQSRREQAQQSLIALLNEERYTAWTADMDYFVEREFKGTAPRVCEVVPRLLWERYEAVRHFELLVDDGTLSTLHALRIECKRLRYSLEFFDDVLGPLTPQLIKPLVAVQDQLGTLHDADVTRERVLEFVVAQTNAPRAIDAAALQAATAYISALQARSRLVYAKFLSHWRVIVAPTFRKRLAVAAAAL